MIARNFYILLVAVLSVVAPWQLQLEGRDLSESRELVPELLKTGCGGSLEPEEIETLAAAFETLLPSPSEMKFNGEWMVSVSPPNEHVDKYWIGCTYLPEGRNNGHAYLKISFFYHCSREDNAAGLSYNRKLDGYYMQYGEHPDRTIVVGNFKIAFDLRRKDLKVDKSYGEEVLKMLDLAYLESLTNREVNEIVRIPYLEIRNLTAAEALRQVEGMLEGHTFQLTNGTEALGFRGSLTLENYALDDILFELSYLYDLEIKKTGKVIEVKPGNAKEEFIKDIKEFIEDPESFIEED